MKRERLEKFICTPKTGERQEVPSDDLHDFHRYGVMQQMFGPSLSFIDETVWSNGPFQSFAGNVRIVRATPPQYVEPHIEDHDQIQVFLGVVERPDSLTVEITLDEEQFQVKSPFIAIYPKGLKHAERILSGSGWFLSVHLVTRCVSYGQRDPTCPVKVGQTYEVTIEEMSRQGQGIARVEGFVVFVPGVQLGDRVTVRITRTSLLSADAELLTS